MKSDDYFDVPENVMLAAMALFHDADGEPYQITYHFPALPRNRDVIEVLSEAIRVSEASKGITLMTPEQASELKKRLAEQLMMEKVKNAVNKRMIAEETAKSQTFNLAGWNPSGKNN